MNTTTVTRLTDSSATEVVGPPATMGATTFVEPGRIEVADLPYPSITDPTDAVVRVVLACVCGSDLWPYRGIGQYAAGPMGSDAMLRSLLTLSDVMGTGHHAAVSAGVSTGSVVAVVGDGAVGLSAVIAAKLLGAARIIVLSRNPNRQALAREFGATDIVEDRGDAAVERVLDLTDGVGVDAALECVGTGEAMTTAIGMARAGGSIGYVGVPHGVELPVETLFFRNIGVRGGAAPVRAYLPELLEDVLAGRIDPGRVFDFETDLEGIADAYAAMDERRAIKALVRVGTG